MKVQPVLDLCSDEVIRILRNDMDANFEVAGANAAKYLEAMKWFYIAHDAQRWNVQEFNPRNKPVLGASDRMALLVKAFAVFDQVIQSLLAAYRSFFSWFMVVVTLVGK